MKSRNDFLFIKPEFDMCWTIEFLTLIIQMNKQNESCYENNRIAYTILKFIHHSSNKSINKYIDLGSKESLPENEVSKTKGESSVFHL